VANPEKGKFEADISQDVIREALESVERRTESPGTEAAVSVEVEVEADPPAEAAPAAVAPSDEELESMRAQLELSQAKGRELMEKLRDTHERMLRASADLENFKKRAQKEKEEIQKFGAEKLLKDFLPVIDNLERALEHAKSATDFESLKTGVAMTRKQFEDALGKHGVKSMSAVGQPFDPRFQEAMQQVETTELPPNHVVAELVRSYTLNDRLIRPALVMVSKAPAVAEPSEQAGEAEQQESDAGDSDGVVNPEPSSP
jgi:molecular chaperone GrpE